MGNTLSEEEEKQILDEAYKLEGPDGSADRVLNSGTAAPNCQPKHTATAGGGGDINHGNSHKHRRVSSTLSEHAETDGRRKRQQTATAAGGNEDSEEEQRQQQDEQQKKLSYYQMAKLGYQELVNAIIRPPRADYKVRT